MKIFLDTANIATIEKFIEMGVINGVTTNPSLLAKEKEGPLTIVKKICQLLPNGYVSVEVTETEPKAVYTQAKKIAQISSNVLVKIPCHKDYYKTIDTLVHENISLNI